MTSGDRATDRITDRWTSVARALAVAALLGGAVFWAYWPTLGVMAQKWTHDAEYSHAFLVPVFAALVLWARRPAATTLNFRPNWWGAALLGLGAGLRLVGAYFFFEWLDQLSLVPTLAGIVVLLGGREAWNWSWPAFVFLIFMVPLPLQLEAHLTQRLRYLATEASTYALQTLGLPALADGNIIVLDDLRVGVVEACSGLGMLATFFALSAAVALVIHRPPVDKVVVFLSAIPIALVMNVARITCTAAAAWSLGSPKVNAWLHDLAGWLMVPSAAGLLWLELRLLDRLLLRPEPTGAVPVVLPVVRGSSAAPENGDATPRTRVASPFSGAALTPPARQETGRLAMGDSLDVAS
jgi:exosortase